MIPIIPPCTPPIKNDRTIKTIIRVNDVLPDSFLLGFTVEAVCCRSMLDSEQERINFLRSLKAFTQQNKPTIRKQMVAMDE